MINGFTLNDPSTVTGEQKVIFEKAEQGFGFVPNIVNGFSESPVLAEAMLDLYGKFSSTSLDPIESHVVLQTINVLNECLYCVPAHSTGARKNGVEESLDESLRKNQPLDDEKLESLRVFTSEMVDQRGHVTGEQFNAFIDAGWSKRAALDVVFFITVKTLTNYGNHITGTDIDEVFQPMEWEPEAAPAS